MNPVGPSSTVTWLDKCAQPSNNDTRCRAIFYARTTSAVLSILGCCLVLFIIIVYKKYRYFTQRMVLYLLLPSLVVAATSLYPYISDDPSCQVVGYFFNFGILSQRLLLMCLIIHLLLFVLLQNRPACLETVFHVVVWIGSLGISAIPIFGSHYGPAGVWCWIKGSSTYENELRVGCFYLWMLGVVLFEIAGFVAIILKVRSQIHGVQGQGADVEAKKQAYKKAIYPLLIYPLVDLLLALPVTANRIQNWLNPSEPIFWLYLCHSVVYPVWGFCNAMMYLLNRETLQQLHPSRLWNRITNWTRTTFSGAEDSARGDVRRVNHYQQNTTGVTANPGHTEDMD